MRTVWKKQLAMTGGPQALDLPAGAEILLFGMQNGEPTVWAEVDPETPADPGRQVEIVGTGHTIPDGARPRGSVIDPPFVWHLYELAR